MSARPTTLKIDIFDIFIDQRHLMMLGHQRCQQG